MAFASIATFVITMCVEFRVLNVILVYLGFNVRHAENKNDILH